MAKKNKAKRSGASKGGKKSQIKAKVHKKDDVKVVKKAHPKQEKRSGASGSGKKAVKKGKKSKVAATGKKVEHKEAAKKKSQSKRVSVFANLQNKFASLLLILVGILSIVFVGAFFVKKAIEPVKLAKVLPFQETVMMAEFDAFGLLGNKDGVSSLADKGLFSVQTFLDTIEETLAADFETDIKPWLGIKHGYALLDIESEEGASTYEHVIFVQSIDRDATLEFLSGFELESHQDSLQSESYKNYSLYSFAVGQNVNFLILDKYFVFARNAEVLKKIVDVRVGEAEPLIAHDEFLKVQNNLKKDIGFVYYIPARLFDYYTGEALTSSSSLIRPILSLFDSQGHSLILEDNSLVVQTYMNFSTGGANEMMLSKLDSHYKAALLEYMPLDFEYFWGSQDLSQIVSDFGAVLNKLHPSSFNILEGVLNAKKDQYFGYDIDLREDIYKVFENEFALGLYTEPDHIDYLFIAEGQDTDHIAKLQAYYLETMTSQGYAALAEAMTEEEIEGAAGFSEMITVFPFDARTNMYTSMFEGNFVMSTDRKLIEHILVNGKTDMNTLTINGYLKDFDELNIMSPAFMGELIGGKASVYLSNFTRIQAAKSIFLDGMALVHVFEF